MIELLSPEGLLADLRVVAEKKQAEVGHDFTYQRILGDPSFTGPDITAGSCYYEHQGTPSCIFGHLLANHYDVPLGQLSDEAEGNSAATVLAQFGFISPTDAATDHRGRTVVQQLADEVQALQDNGTPWVEAVSNVEARYQRGEFS